VLPALSPPRVPPTPPVLPVDAVIRETERVGSRRRTAGVVRVVVITLVVVVGHVVVCIKVGFWIWREVDVETLLYGK